MIAVHDVVAGYGKMTILNGVSFATEPGTITTIIGPNGAGKSTLFKAIFGLVSVTSGTVTIDGRTVTGATPAQMLSAGVTYVPQGRNIIPSLSVWHNLELGGITLKDRTTLNRRIDQVMERFAVLREKRNDAAASLSGGQQKQLEIARALLLEPKLMLVDEPSIGLSPALVKETFQALGQLCSSGVTILMIEQNAKKALAMSHMGLVLELGRTRMHGKAEDLLNDPRTGQLFLGGGTSGPAP